MAPAALRDASNGMMTTWGMLAGEWVLLMVTAWYLEQVSCAGIAVRHAWQGFGAWGRASGAGDVSQVKVGATRMQPGFCH